MLKSSSFDTKTAQSLCLNNKDNYYLKSICIRFFKTDLIVIIVFGLLLDLMGQEGLSIALIFSFFIICSLFRLLLWLVDGSHNLYNDLYLTNTNKKEALLSFLKTYSQARLKYEIPHNVAVIPRAIPNNIKARTWRSSYHNDDFYWAILGGKGFYPLSDFKNLKLEFYSIKQFGIDKIENLISLIEESKGKSEEIKTGKLTKKESNISCKTDELDSAAESIDIYGTDATPCDMTATDDDIKEAEPKLTERMIDKAPVNKSMVADELIKLNQLKKEGVLTDEEFEVQKKKLLS